MTQGELKMVEQRMRDVGREIADEMMRILRDDRRKLMDALTGLGLIDPEEELWTINDLIDKFGVSRTKIYYMMKDGSLPYIKMGEAKSSPVKFRPVDARIAFMEKRK